MKRILCIGQAACDITLVVDKFPLENKKMRSKMKVECAGGSAFNCAYMLASWGMDTTFVGCIGKDYYGSVIRKQALDVGLNVHFEEKDFTTTSHIIANISNGSRTIITDKNQNVKVESFKTDEEYDILVLDSNEVDLSLEMLEKYKNAVSVLDGGKYCDEVMKLADKATYFVCSKDFAEGYTGFPLNDEESYKKALDMMEMAFKNQVIITLESKGSFTKINDEYKLVPSIYVKAIDSTGAGDIYHGAFTYFIMNGYSLLDSMKYANVAGALSVKKIGSKASIPSLNDVLREANDEVI